MIVPKSCIQQEVFFHQKIGLKCKKDTNKMLHWEYNFVWCWNFDTTESRSEIAWKFWNVMLEKDGEDQLDQPCEKWKSVT